MKNRLTKLLLGGAFIILASSASSTTVPPYYQGGGGSSGDGRVTVRITPDNIRQTLGGVVYHAVEVMAEM